MRLLEILLNIPGFLSRVPVGEIEKRVPGIFGLGNEDEVQFLEIMRLAQQRDQNAYAAFLDFLENHMPPTGDGVVNLLFRWMARNRFRLILVKLPLSKDKVAPATGGGRVEVRGTDHRVEVILWIGNRVLETNPETVLRELAAGNIVKIDPVFARLMNGWGDAFIRHLDEGVEALRIQLPQILARIPNGADIDRLIDTQTARNERLINRARVPFLWWIVSGCFATIFISLIVAKATGAF